MMYIKQIHEITYVVTMADILWKLFISIQYYMKSNKHVKLYDITTSIVWSLFLGVKGYEKWKSNSQPIGIK